MNWRQPWRRLQEIAERRLPSLTRWRRRESLPIVLHRRRIYIVPTGFGLGFAVILVVMLVGGLNYSNNAALLLTCLLGAATAGSMLTTFRALDGVRLQALRADTVRAGSPVRMTADIGADARIHQGIRLDVLEATQSFFLPAGTPVTLELSLPTDHRGWQELPRMRVHSTWPFGMFRAWSWLHPDQLILVYPRSELDGPPPYDPDGDAERGRTRQGDELSSLRDYRPGDPRRQIAWKLSARHHGLLVKDFDQPAPQRDWRLDWQSIHGLDTEARIARIARWIDQAHAAGRRWSLQLPDRYFDLARGDEHYHRCMTALALQP
jgi:uncharacterized protein (DUF58 family)